MRKINYNQIEESELSFVHYRINHLLGGAKGVCLTNLVDENNFDENFDFYIDDEGDVCTVKKGDKV